MRDSICVYTSNNNNSSLNIIHFNIFYKICVNSFNKLLKLLSINLTIFQLK